MRTNLSKRRRGYPRRKVGNTIDRPREYQVFLKGRNTPRKTPAGFRGKQVSRSHTAGFIVNLGIASLGALFLFAISGLKWRRSVKIALALVIIEGAIRKWVLPGASDLIYFLKDIVLLGAYVRYFIIDRALKRSIRLRGETIIVGCDADSRFSGSQLKARLLAVRLFGFKAYLWYVPLC